MRRSSLVLWVVSIGLFLSSCGGDQKDLEIAKQLLGSGRESDASRAASIVQPMLSSTDPFTRLEAVEIYVGAQFVVAGFDTIQILANINYRNGEEGAKLLRSVINTVGVDRLTVIQRAVDAAEALTGTAPGEPNKTAAAASSFYRNGGERYQLRADYVAGMAYFAKAMFVSLDTTGFNESAFDFNECVDTYQNVIPTLDEEEDTLTLSLFRARAFWGRVGFDDADEGDDDNHDLIDVVNDFQKQVDADKDGFTPDTNSALDSATDICTYLRDNNA